LPTARLLSVLATLALLVGLALPTVLPEVANVGFFVFAGLAIILLMRAAPWGELLRRPGVAIPLVAGAILTFCFALTASEPWHALAAMLFMPLFLVAPMAALLQRLPLTIDAQGIGIAALAGTAAAAALALFETQVLGLSRAGVTVNNPIHFADLSLTLGFVALVGVYGERRWVRIAVLAGPVLALLAVLLSGSRGPLVAFVPMLLVALMMFIAHRAPPAGRWAALVAAGLASLLLIALAWRIDAVQQVAAFNDIARVLSNETVDGSTTERLIMYRSAFNAFLASPVYGHGLIDYVAAAARHAPAGATFPIMGHLHNDIADFAVAGGGLGLLAYALFLLAPIVEVLRRPRSWPAIHLALSISAGYLAMGLTNAMIGILSQTVLYGFCLALVVHLAGEPRAASRAESAR
jgi:O-antigen ligase